MYNYIEVAGPLSIRYSTLISIPFRIKYVWTGWLIFAAAAGKFRTYKHTVGKRMVCFLKV